MGAQGRALKDDLQGWKAVQFSVWAPRGCSESPLMLSGVFLWKELSYITFGLMIVNCGMNSLCGALILSLIK